MKIKLSECSEIHTGKDNLLNGGNSMQSYRLVVYLRCRFLLDLIIHKMSWRGKDEKSKEKKISEMVLNFILPCL